MTTLLEKETEDCELKAKPGAFGLCGCTKGHTFAAVTEERPTVTVIIPARHGQAEVLAVEAARRLEYPAGRVEIVVARGRQPARQRNAALRMAKGELIYFLDDDSVPAPGNLRKALEHFQRPEVVMVGGPNLCPVDAPELERIFAVVLASALAFGPSRARYDATGIARESGEKELILCNLLARRSAIMDLGGFDEALYPNEENALMDALQERGGRLIYDPELVVRRRPRATLGSFARMLRTYGRGRAEQFRRYPTLGSALNFVPPLFVVYLAGVAPWFGGWVRWPLILYVVALGIQAVQSAGRHGWVRSVAAAPLIVLTHVMYGCGFWHGLFTKLPAGARDETPGTPGAEAELEVKQTIKRGEG